MTMGGDLFLLAIDEGKGKIREPQRLTYALRASELVELVVLGRVDLQDESIRVISPRPLGIRHLDAALDLIVNAKKPLTRSWVRRQRVRIYGEYLEDLVSAGTVELVDRRIWHLFKDQSLWLVDRARRDEIRARLDEVLIQGWPTDPRERAFAGLLHTSRLDWSVYPGKEGSAARLRLRDIALGKGAPPNSSSDPVTVSITNAIRAVRRAISADAGASGSG